MKKICLIIFLCFFNSFVSCEQKNSNNKDEESSNKAKIELDKESINKLNYTEYILDQKATSIVDQWQKYGELLSIVNNLKQGDVNFFINNHEILELLFKDLRESLPEKINSDAILSRIKAMETVGYKLEDFLARTNPVKEDVLSALKEFLVSFSNLNLQINKKLERDSQQINKPE